MVLVLTLEVNNCESYDCFIVQRFSLMAKLTCGFDFEDTFVTTDKGKTPKAVELVPDLVLTVRETVT